MTYGYLAWTGYKRVKAIQRVSGGENIIIPKGAYYYVTVDSPINQLLGGMTHITTD